MMDWNALRPLGHIISHSRALHCRSLREATTALQLLGLYPRPRWPLLKKRARSLFLPAQLLRQPFLTTTLRCRLRARWHPHTAMSWNMVSSPARLVAGTTGMGTTEATNPCFHILIIPRPPLIIGHTIRHLISGVMVPWVRPLHLAVSVSLSVAWTSSGIITPVDTPWLSMMLYGTATIQARLGLTLMWPLAWVTASPVWRTIFDDFFAYLVFSLLRYLFRSSCDCTCVAICAL